MSLDGADELARAGYAWEIADAPVLHRALTLADLSHVLELVRIGAVPPASATLLARELLDMLDAPPGSVDYSPAFGEMYSSREHHLAGRIGDEAGWLHTGRTRREAMRIAYRITVRRQVVDLIAAAAALVEAMCDQAEAHVDTVMPDYTYLQPAEPTTFGHYLASFIDPVLRDARRLRAEFPDINASPMGAGAASGSALLHERGVAGSDLGFDGPLEHVRDAMWQNDPFTHVLTSATTLVTGQDKVAEDLEIFSSREFDFVELGDGLVRPSVLMPHKRNPYALTVIRGTTAILIGRTTGQLALAKAPSARSDLYIYAYGELPRSLDLAIRTTELTAAVVRTLRVRSDRMGAALTGRHTGAAEVAAHLVREAGIDYRTAHTIVSRAVDAARGAGGEVTASGIAEAAAAAGAPQVTITDAALRLLNDPRHVAASHDGLGGSAVAEMTRFIHDRRTRAAEMAAWAALTRGKLDEGEAGTVSRARDLVSGQGHDQRETEQQ